MSSISSINNASNAQATANAITSATNQTLSEQDFLNLLVTQMTQQDPLDPMTNEDLLSQMVQFSTLQGNTAMQSTLSSLQTTEQFTQANSMIGAQVTVQTDSSGDTAQGVVSGISLSSGTPQIIVNGQAYSLSSVLSVTTPSTTGSSNNN